jgi:hypothetical protein
VAAKLKKMTNKFELEPDVVLTCEPPAAPAGLPVLVIDGRPYQAADSIKRSRLGKNITAAEYVREKVEVLGSEALRQMARWFCSSAPGSRAD